MFDNETQRTIACGLLVRSMGPRFSTFWDSDGPTDAAITTRLSSGEQVMLQAAIAIWNGDESLRFARILTLDASKLRMVGELLAAIADNSASTSAVDAWIERYGA